MAEQALGNPTCQVFRSDATPNIQIFWAGVSVWVKCKAIPKRTIVLDMFQSRFFNVSVSIVYIYDMHTLYVKYIYNIFTCCLTGFPAGCHLILTNPTHPSRTCKKSGPWHGDSRPRPLQLCGIPYFTFGKTWAMYPNLMCCITWSLRDCCVKCCKSILPKLCSSVSPRPKCFVHFIK